MQNLKSIKKPKGYKTLNSVYNINISVKKRKKRKKHNLTLDCYVVFNKERIDETIFKALSSNPCKCWLLGTRRCRELSFVLGRVGYKERVAGHAAVRVGRVGTKR